MLKYFLDVWCCKDLSIGVIVRNVKDDVNFFLGCIIGFVFVFGFILVGVGFVLGWRMGWIIFFC